MNVIVSVIAAAECADDIREYVYRLADDSLKISHREEVYWKDQTMYDLSLSKKVAKAIFF